MYVEEQINPMWKSNCWSPWFTHLVLGRNSKLRCRFESGWRDAAAKKPAECIIFNNQKHNKRSRYCLLKRRHYQSPLSIESVSHFEIAIFLVKSKNRLQILHFEPRSFSRFQTYGSILLGLSNFFRVLFTYTHIDHAFWGVQRYCRTLILPDTVFIQGEQAWVKVSKNVSTWICGIYPIRQHKKMIICISRFCINFEYGNSTVLASRNVRTWKLPYWFKICARL